MMMASKCFKHLAVSDIEAARKDLLRHGVNVSEVFHGSNVHTGTSTLVKTILEKASSFCAFDFPALHETMAILTGAQRNNRAAA